MKNTTKLLTLALMLMVFASFSVQAQCDVKDYTRKCVDQYVKPRGYQFLKSYKIDGNGGKTASVRYSYVFSRGTTYLITLANSTENSDGVKVTLLAPNREEIASSYSEKYKKNFPLQLRCQRTGIYYLNYEFDKGSDYCAASVLGFKR